MTATLATGGYRRKGTDFVPGPRRGGAAVELAIVLPFLMFLFLIGIDWARIFTYTVTLDNCARAAALFAMDTYDNANWQGSSGLISTAQSAAVAAGATLNPPLTAAGVNVQTGQTDADGNSVVIVTVTYSFKPIATFPGIPSTLSITRTVQMRSAPSTPS